MTVYPLTASFVRGEISPKLRGRVDIEQYGQALADATNWLVTPQGGVDRRPGTKFVAPLRDETEKGRLIEFEFNEEQAYCLIFNDGQVQIATLGSMVGQTAQNITGITKANPAVITYSGSDTFANGDRVLVAGVVGMTEINNRVVTVANVNTGANTFECSGLDSSGFTTYASGGTVQELVQVADMNSAFTEDKLPTIHTAQAADTLYVTKTQGTAHKLVRTSETSWARQSLDLEDGPYDDERENRVTPASTGGVVDVAMTSNSTSSYTAADDDTSANAYKVFDRDLSTTLDLSGTSGWVEIDFPSTTEKAADAYWLAASPSAPENMPTHWTFEGYDGSTWTIVDARAGETAWEAGERRYYEFQNTATYLKYRFQWYAVDGGESTSIAQCVIHQNVEDQTPFNFTFDAGATGIGSGEYPGVTMRILGADGRWRWVTMQSIVSSSPVKVYAGVLHGHALLDTTPISRVLWGMLWHFTSVGFYQDRLMFGGAGIGQSASFARPNTIFLSESAYYPGFGTSDPPVESDAIIADVNVGQLSQFMFVEDMGDIIVGAGSGIIAVGPAAQAEPFSSFNIRARKISSIGSAQVQPLLTDTGLLYIDRYRRRLIALRQRSSNEGGGYATDDVSWWSDHLLYGQVVDMAFQEDRFNVAWFVLADGSLVSCTYLPEFGVVGFTPVVIGGTDVAVESVAAIPSAGGAAVYLIVKRTINGVTRRYVEVMAPRFETGDVVEDAVYLDAAATVTGSGITTVTGLTWLIGETVGVYADGVDIGDATVSSAGTITLPGGVSADKVTVGLRYTSRLETLRAPTAGNRDGSSYGRQMVLHSVALDLLNAKGLRVGSLSDTRPWPHPDLDAAAGQLNTGVFPNLPVDDSHRNNGVVVAHTDRAYPATIRALIAGLDGAP